MCRDLGKILNYLNFIYFTGLDQRLQTKYIGNLCAHFEK